MRTCYLFHTCNASVVRGIIWINLFHDLTLFAVICHLKLIKDDGVRLEKSQMFDPFKIIYVTI